MKRFKIDFYDSSYNPFGLYVLKTNYGFLKSWKLINTFETKQKALDHYNLIKDLPEYLD